MLLPPGVRCVNWRNISITLDWVFEESPCPRSPVPSARSLRARTPPRSARAHGSHAPRSQALAHRRTSISNP